MNPEYYYEIKSQLDEIKLGDLADIYGADSQIIPFIIAMLENYKEIATPNKDEEDVKKNLVEEDECEDEKKMNRIENKHTKLKEIVSKIPIDIMCEMKDKLDNLCISEKHKDFWPRIKQNLPNDRRSTIPLLMQKMYKLLNEYLNVNNIKDLNEKEKHKICLEVYSDFKDEYINHNNIKKILNMENGKIRNVDNLAKKIMNPNIIKKRIPLYQQSGGRCKEKSVAISLKKRNRIKKRRISKKKKLI